MTGALPLGTRSALVTGASRGIGQATARTLARSGARVIVLSRDANALDALATALRGDGHLVDVIACDVGDRAQLSAAIDRVRETLGSAPDILVNNAGAFELATIEGTELADFAATLDTNLIAPFQLVHAFIGDMRARGSGHVVNVGSVADRMAFPENGAYAASKFGLRGLHEVLREEMRGTGVRTTLVSPGAVDTSLWDTVDPDNRPGFTPRARMMRPDDVAAAILYAVTAPPRVNVDELRLSPA